MREILMLIGAAALMLTGCVDSATPVPPPDPAALLQQSAAVIRSATTLRMTIERDGAEYGFPTLFGDVIVNRLEGQYIAPDIIQAKARVLLSRLPADVDIFARGPDQWLRALFTNNQWQKGDFVPGFDPAVLVAAEGQGLQAALASLQNLNLVGETQLEDGTPVYQITSTADGQNVSALIADLISMTGPVQVEAFIEREKKLPLKFIVVQTDTGSAETGPTRWTVEIYDFDAPPAITPPDGA